MENIESICSKNVVSIGDDDILVVSLNKEALRHLPIDEETELINKYINYLEKALPNYKCRIIGIPSIFDVGIVYKYPNISSSFSGEESCVTLPF